MRTLCASTLIGEFFVVGFAALVAMKDPDLAGATLWTVSGIAMFLCLALCGMVTRPGGIALGWALQIALIASGFVVPAMFFMGAVFAALWWASVHYGRKIDEAKARFAAQAAQADQVAPADQAAQATPAAQAGSTTPDAV